MYMRGRDVAAASPQMQKGFRPALMYNDFSYGLLPAATLTDFQSSEPMCTRYTGSPGHRKDDLVRAITSLLYSSRCWTMTSAVYGKPPRASSPG